MISKDSYKISSNFTTVLVRFLMNKSLCAYYFLCYMLKNCLKIPTMTKTLSAQIVCPSPNIQALLGVHSQWFIPHQNIWNTKATASCFENMCYYVLHEVDTSLPPLLCVFHTNLHHLVFHSVKFFKNCENEVHSKVVQAKRLTFETGTS